MAARPSAVPASQNTAPVAEFRCLFTHDVRKKQKKWQDGFLKYHSFNRRVMVYDQSRLFVGDTYWKESDELHEGDELQLDKPVMVEVAEAMGVTQTDLTPLFEKNKASPPQSKPAPTSRPLPRPAPAPNNSLRPNPQLRHRSLNTLLGPSRTPIGKAKPIITPYEARKEKENREADQRANKRQKTSHNPVTSPPLSIPRRVITISTGSETDNISSDVTLPSTPPGMVNPHSRPSVAPAAPGTVEPPRTNAAPRIPKGKVPVPSVRPLEALETPHKPPPSSPPVSASNRITNVAFALYPVPKSSQADSISILGLSPPSMPEVVNRMPRRQVAEEKPLEPPEQALPSQSPPRKAKSLRLSAGVKRGKLLCQAPSLRPTEIKPVSEPKRVPKPKKRPASESTRDDSAIVIIDDDDVAPPSKPAKPEKSTSKTKKRNTQSPPLIVNEPESLPPEPSPEPSFGGSDDMELIHGLMDQQLALTPSPSRLQRSRPKSPSVLNESSPKPPAAKKTFSKTKQTDQSLTKAKKSEVSAGDAGEKSQGRKKETEKATSLWDPPPPIAPRERLERPVSKEGHQIDLHEDGPRNPPAFLSPKKASFSTGGFLKKPKRTQQQQPLQPNPSSPHRESAVLPPHPLRSSRTGPLMSTTELSALLQNSSKIARIEDDPIRDYGTQHGSSSTRQSKMRRSRSENDADAPIPSTSEAWEEVNLRTASKLKADDNEAATTASKADEAEALAKPKPGGLAALVKKTDPRRKFHRTSSLNVNITAILGNSDEHEVVVPPLDDDVGPWSTEAFDLFDWRPPKPDGEDGSVGNREGVLVDKI
ncbi:hypothetical protein P280DRAFT_468806 [Massarina eburnea CBS 473.64]|uniref:5'-3' DNA helicase ZGRF1-like N-terminal domain-containing protein n=1 Tax=Massarina eburnea CBS 473.64 TaxID=1395130 RepID=A0A6A6S0N4_9PLEO|nr:hypothetical protein P280DRAFT_468806 [Massarina eburnea CBS 473.64]